MTHRRILRISGADTHDFLQGLITNDIQKLDAGLVYAAILTPQGKYLADFFLKADGDDVLLDVAAELGDMLVQRLSMYKLRAAVEISETDLHMHRGLGDVPQGANPDPRLPALGWRAYRETAQTGDTVNWDALRVQHVVPETGIELTGDTFILEVGFERLAGVDFRKGCYVGQEVTARMKHKTELRKGLAQVSINGDAQTGDPVLAGDKPAGTLLTRSNDHALAYLRFERAKEPMTSGTATVIWSNRSKGT
jgi:folate-binding protein YgfZ